MTEVKRYSTSMIVLHWVLAIVILGAIFMGALVLDEMENGHPQKVLLLKLHIVVGAGIMLFTLLRLALRFTTPQPVSVANSMMDKAGTSVHYLLYLLTILTVLSGVTLAISAGLPAVLLNHVGELPKNYEDFIAHEAHDIFANLLLLTISLHAAAALYHQLILKDGLLSRMSWRKDI